MFMLYADPITSWPSPRERSMVEKHLIPVKSKLNFVPSFYVGFVYCSEAVSTVDALTGLV